MTKTAVKPKKSAKKTETAAAEESLTNAGTDRKVDGALSAPKKGSVVLAKDLRGDELYVNVRPHEIGSPYKMFRFLGKSGADRVKVTMYADNLKEWLTLVVPLDHAFTTDERYLDAMAKPVERDTKLTDEQKAKRNANLAEYRFKKSKPDPESKPHDGKRAFKGKILDENVLYDAGDGAEVARAKVGEDLKALAKKHKVELVSQSAVTEYALWVFTKAWQESREKAKAGAK